MTVAAGSCSLVSREVVPSSQRMEDHAELHVPKLCWMSERWMSLVFYSGVENIFISLV
jgi:hypothetical protein